MPVYRITGVRTEVHLIETYVKARDPEAAEDLFYAVLAGEHEPCSGPRTSTAQTPSSSSSSASPQTTTQSESAQNVERFARGVVSS